MARLALADFQLEGFVARFDGGILRHLEVVEVLAQARLIPVLEPQGEDTYLVLGLAGEVQGHGADDGSFHANGRAAARQIYFGGGCDAIRSRPGRDRAGPEQTHVSRLPGNLPVGSPDPDREGDAEANPSPALRMRPGASTQGLRPTGPWAHRARCAFPELRLRRRRWRSFRGSRPIGALV